jgi:hypothetical protein
MGAVERERRQAGGIDDADRLSGSAIGKLQGADKTTSR